MAKILVVEDDESMNEILHRTLADRGYGVETVFNADQALRLCREKKFDLLITDVRLPGTDGIDSLRAIRQIQPGIASIVITGYASAETPARAIKLQVSDYLLKPFHLKSFLGSVAHVLEAKELGIGGRKRLSNLLSRPDNFDHPELRKLELEREQSLRGLYVGIRSGFLGQGAATEVYIRIELLEPKFIELLKEPNPEKMRVTKFRVHYAAVSDLISSINLKKLSEDEIGSTISIPREQMSALFEGVLTSRIQLYDLFAAPFLRRARPSALDSYPELVELRDSLWPDLAKQS